MEFDYFWLSVNHINIRNEHIKKILSIALISVIFCASHAIASERLNNDELKALYTDVTISVVHFKLGPGKSYFAADGTIRSLSESGKERIGKWWIDEKTNKRCVRWNDKNQNYCHYTERNDDGTHTLIHGGNGKKLVEIKSTQAGNQL